MAWIKNMKWIGSLIVLIGILTACSVSYKFNGASIDYAKTKTISFENFPNRSVGFVWGPMENMFNTALQDVYLQQTRLTQVRRGGDLQLSGTIFFGVSHNKYKQKKYIVLPIPIEKRVTNL